MSSKPNTAKVIRFHKTGGPEVFQLEDLPVPEPAAGEVRIRVKAVGLNRVEMLFREGTYFIDPILPSRIGIEASGLVEAVGEGVDPSWIGKEVSSVPVFDTRVYGVTGEVAILPIYAIAEKPSNISFEEGASVWMQYLAAWGALKPYGNVQPGEFVLFDAAASAVGFAIIEIAKVEGAKTIALTRTASKKAALLAFGADHVIVTSEENLVDRVNEITDGKGARVVIDFIAGTILEDLAKVTAMGGQILMAGYLGTDKYGYSNGISTPYPLYEAISKGINIRGYSAYFVAINAPLFEEAKKYIITHLEDGDFKPRIDKVFSLENFAESHRYMDSNQSTGKIIIRI